MLTEFVFLARLTQIASSSVAIAGEDSERLDRFSTFVSVKYYLTISELVHEFVSLQKDAPISARPLAPY